MTLHHSQDSQGRLCTRYHELISRYVDGEVTARQRRDVLEHVEHCHDCAAWLARTRQADVLLKGIPDIRPSDKVRDAVLAASKNKRPPYKSAPPPHHIHLATGTDLRLYTSALLLRLDTSPQRLALALAAALLSIVGVAYWLNLLPPIWGYSQFGFLFPHEQEAPATSTPLPVLSTAADNRLAAPNVLRVSPPDGTLEAGPQTALSVGFDVPMDRASVEDALLVEPPVAGAFDWKYDNELTFMPTGAGLLRGVTYTVRLSDTARSLAGTRIEKPRSWVFYTHENYSVQSGVAPNSSIAVTDSFTLLFDVPMDTASAVRDVWLRADGYPDNIEASHEWDAEGKTLTISPQEAMPIGVVTLRVGTDALTRSGDTLGRTAEFAYRVSPPSPGLHMAGGRLVIAQADHPASIRVMDGSGAEVERAWLKVYDLPGEQLSALGAQAREWPLGLPAGFPDGLAPASSLSIRHIEQPDNPEASPVDVSGQLPGMYLVVAASSGVVSDWQLLIVADRHIALVGDDAPFWLTDEDGRPWAEAEVSLYSPQGMLLEKGVTNASGLWSPISSLADVTLAIARDPQGHLAAMVLDPLDHAVEGMDALAATLQTDQTAYYPGQAVNFRALLLTQTQPPPDADSGVTVSMLNPDGMPVSVLNLKPDSVGGVIGLFRLASVISPGQYTIRVSMGVLRHDFPLEVLPTRDDSLSVYVAPQSEQTGAMDLMTYTVGVLGPDGQPASGADVTAVLRIPGDEWSSAPVSAITGVDGNAIIVMPIPDWLTFYKDPGIYLDAQAYLNSLKGSVGRASAPLDLVPTPSLLYGIGNVASPHLDLAAITEPQPDGSTRLRLVTLGAAAQPVNPVNGYVLVQAETPSGERQLWSIDLAGAGGDVTLPLPPAFAGGAVSFMRAGVDGYRHMALPAGRNLDLQLTVNTAEIVVAGAPLSIILNLLNKDGQGVAGVASIWFRRASGDAQPDESNWEPAASLDMSGALTTTIAAPGAPGLWYIMSEVATATGGYTRSRSVVEVLPGPTMQLPPLQQILSGIEQEVSISIYNPLDTPLMSGVRAEGNGSVTVVGRSSQSIEVPAHGRQRLSWRFFAARPGNATLAFSFLPSAGVGGVWTLDLRASDNPGTNKTYASGVLLGEQSVGVLVPSGLQDNGVQLEIRASTSLLSTLADASQSLSSQSVEIDVARWAAQLSAATSGLDRSIALQQLYSAQRADGGWGNPSPSSGQVLPDPSRGPSSLARTADVLLALRRQSLAWAEMGGEPEPAIDNMMTSRALAYLSWESKRPVGMGITDNELDEKARALYTLSLYGAIEDNEIRPLMVYAMSDTEGAKLSAEGVAWLALALWHTGNEGDALALIDRLLASKSDLADVADVASAPLLEALVVMGSADRPMGENGKEKPATSAYKGGAQECVQALIKRRQGALWATPSLSADALWSLALYAAQEPNAGSFSGSESTPAISLNDHAVPVETQIGNDGNGSRSIAVFVSGGTLHAGTNWLRLQAPTGKPLYYSLTLRATR